MSVLPSAAVPRAWHVPVPQHQTSPLKASHLLLLLYYLMPTGSPTGARRFGHRSFHLPSYSAELPLALGCLSHLVEQVNHLCQLRETTQPWQQVNPGAGEQSTAGSSGLVLCLLRGLGTKDVGARSSAEPLHKHQLC